MCYELRLYDFTFTFICDRLFSLPKQRMILLDLFQWKFIVDESVCGITRLGVHYR